MENISKIIDKNKKCYDNPSFPVEVDGKVCVAQGWVLVDHIMQIFNGILVYGSIAPTIIAFS